MPTSLTGHEGDIIYPADATTVHYEAEICVVIGKKAQNITEAQVKSHIFGVTPCNDVSERAWQKQDLQWFRAKASDTFGPMGPALVTNVDYDKLKLIGRHNGKVVQETTTDLLIFSIDNIVSYTSRYITLEPGDVIFTGTPGTTQAMKPGDTFEVEIPGVGLLRKSCRGGEGAGDAAVARIAAAAGIARRPTSIGPRVVRRRAVRGRAEPDRIQPGLVRGELEIEFEPALAGTASVRDTMAAELNADIEILLASAEPQIGQLAANLRASAYRQGRFAVAVFRALIPIPNPYIPNPYSLVPNP